MRPYKKSSSGFSATIIAACLVIVCLVATSIYYFGFSGSSLHATKKVEKKAADGRNAGNGHNSFKASVDLSPSQLHAITIEPVIIYSFHIQREAVGSVAYPEKKGTDDDSSDKRLMPDRANKLIVANVPESDSPLVHVGQPVEAKVAAYPDQSFDGKVFALGGNAWDVGGNPALDPNTHRITVICEIADPKDSLYPGMLSNLIIQVQKPVESVAIPMSGVVRKGDGVMTAWVTEDRQHFEERVVKVGLQQNGYDQILDGLNAGELVVTDGAVFVSNILYAPPSD